MTGWIVAAVLYVIAAIGLYSTACDVNSGPIRTTWKRAAFFFWPLVVVFLVMGDIWDWAKGDAPNWLQR